MSKTSSSEVQIFHNPRCSKSRQTLALLQEQGLSPTVVEYLNATPNAEHLDEILKLLSLEPRDLMRTSETAYKESGADDDSLSRAQLIQKMIENPILIERPIVIANGKAAIGRPPETVLEIL